MPRMLRTILFDLDGVLIDSLASIQAAMNHALTALGRPRLDAAAVRPFIGPPLHQSAPVLLDSNDAGEIARFVELYRGHYAAICERESAPAAGLDAALGALAGRWTLAVATHKPEAFARAILGALGVAGAFAAIVGGAMDGSDTKAAIIGRALAAVGAGPEGAVMIGDRSHDVIGAAAHGIPTIGVLHGMGSREELAAAGARWIVDDLGGAVALLERLAAEGGQGAR